MVNSINTYSASFKYDLNNLFVNNEENIKKFLTSNIPKFLSEDPIASQNIENFQELKKFLGNKRKKIEKDDYDQNPKYFKKDSIEEKKEKKYINIFITKTQNNFILNNYIYSKSITIFKKPIILSEIFDNQTINVDIINDNLYLSKIYKDLNKFNYNNYFLNKDNIKLDVSNELSLYNKTNKEITIKNETFDSYLLIMKSKLPKIEDKDILLENIYPVEDNDKEEKESIPPKNISKIFFYYFRINSELQNKYSYIESKNRKELYKILESFLISPSKNVIIIVGPKGVGKSASLIKFSFCREFRIFYFNLETYQIYSDEIKKKELKIQLTKLFGDFVINDENKIKEEIEKYINSSSNINGFDFIYNIINLFKKFTENVDGLYFGFIIDQYSINYNNKLNDDNYINKLISLINTSLQIKLILCPTTNNSFLKEQISSMFLHSLEINKYFDIFYFQEFIPSDKIHDIIENASNEYKDIMEELGSSLKCFYELSNVNIDSYKDYLAKTLSKNIKEYYLPNNNINNDQISDMNISIIKLLDLVKCEKLISSVELKNNISIFPLEYLNITKYKINKDIIDNISKKMEQYNKTNGYKNTINEEDNLIKYLKLLWNIEDNNKYDEIIEKKFFIKEEIIEDFINNYIEKDKNSLNIYGDYYGDFISKYNDFFDFENHKYTYIYVYKLDFSMTFVENILLDLLYKHIQKESILFSNLLDKGASGGLFELLIGYYIQKNGEFLGNKIEKTIYIYSLVPQNYSISYYSSYNKNINNFKELIFETTAKKKKIPFKNIFIKQILFNSKYYDMAILIKSKVDNTYDLIVLQIAIKKEKEKRLTKDEHELILRAVKINLENHFDIIIEKAYFIYVLSKKDGKIEDNETKEYCDKKGIQYIGFDTDSINPIDNFENVLDKAFITNTFPVHNSASLLKFSNKNLNDEIEYLKLKEIIDNNLKLCNELNKYLDFVNNIFKNKFSDTNISSGQIKYFDLKYKLFNLNKSLLDYLSDFSFLIINENQGKVITIHFNQISYNCNKKYEKYIFKTTKSAKYEILFCFSSVPLKINEKIHKD